MVVIVIILILLSIGAGVGQWQSRRAEIDMTRTALENLNHIAVEMQALGMAVGTDPPGTDNLSSTPGILAKAKATRSLRLMVGGIPDNLLTATDVKDAWGNSLWMDKDGNSDPSGGDLPKRGDGVFYFASAGPDGAWGDHDGAEAAKTQEADNLYSYEVN